MTAARTIRVSAGEYGGAVRVEEGPALLADIGDDSHIDSHRKRHGSLPHYEMAGLLDIAELSGLRGRGGAGFPFARKLRTAAEARGRASVVVNISEGEPASFKDAALAVLKPHLILDGAALAAEVLEADDVHVVVPTEHPTIVRSIARALDERETDRGPRVWHLHEADHLFISGQARAVVELISGRPNLPVTTWKPEAMEGIGGRPTLLSNAETYAQLAYASLHGLAAIARLGTANELGTRLLTLPNHCSGPTVLEVPQGTPWNRVLTEDEIERPVLVGGYHGSWLLPGALRDARVSPSELTEMGVSLGAGVVLPLRRGDCPLHRTAELVGYLASQSAGHCGPCANGLPALAEALHLAYVGDPMRNRTLEVIGLVKGRGACAHPDGTARLAASLLANFTDELTLHAAGSCGFVGPNTLGRAG
jgi:NADH:ubiquinone oxidoreductase subunit F (NADH-binding)